jgi:hypothetical protein
MLPVPRCLLDADPDFRWTIGLPLTLPGEIWQYLTTVVGVRKHIYQMLGIRVNRDSPPLWLLLMLVMLVSHSTQTEVPDLFDVFAYLSEHADWLEYWIERNPETADTAEEYLAMSLLRWLWEREEKLSEMDIETERGILDD